jgi:hypothetical protein
MTWFKVDDAFYDHPKVFDAPDCAVALWVRAGSWSARNQTDGYVPAGLPARLCGDHEIAVEELVQRGLWSRRRHGFVFHDWRDYQPTKAERERDKVAATERKRRQRERAKAQLEPPVGGAEEVPAVTPMSRRDIPSGHGVTLDILSRPDPYQRSPGGDLSSAPAASQLVGEVVDAEIAIDPSPSSALVVAAEAPIAENAGQLTRAWIDHCSANGVKLTESIIKRYAVRISSALKQGFPPPVVRSALASMLGDNEAARPSLLDNYLVRAQTGPPKPPRRMSRGEAAARRLAPTGIDLAAQIHYDLTRPA